VRLWDSRNGRELARLPLPFRVLTVRFVGSLLLTADDGGESYRPTCYRLEIVWPRGHPLDPMTFSVHWLLSWPRPDNAGTLRPTCSARLW